MKLFSWVQNKFSGNQSISKPDIHPCHKLKSGDKKEEFSDWPKGVLSIGTLFDKPLKNDTTEHNELQENSFASTQKQIQELSSEEVKQLQNELSGLISSSDLDYLSGFGAGNNNNSSSNIEENDQEENDDQHYTIIPNNANDVYLDNKMSNAISKKSLSFILKKIFVCGGGLGPSPTSSLRDPIITPPKTRMHKILRALLRKKIIPQSPTMVRKRYLDGNQTGSNSNFDDDDDLEEIFYLEGTDNSKWVKTDTEYIVLEI